ncbi:MFS transporter [Clostridium oryzae]|uniref:Major facilitator superfamily protein n=1 Tax=Clostridium oryzae TaxID=1450648 RepID=A0A1V4ICY4_9CLOT|nr:MFS transporter [Clostridium oryzae]OPJ57831.1 major facilitator superfamily protein [Clostridium oryzae]
MNMNTKLRKNVKVSYVYNFMMQMDITSAIWVLYLAYRGMSLVEIGIIESIYHMTSLLFELPTGAIADIYGKKFSVVLGRVLSIVSCVLMIVSTNFWGFALAFVLTAAGNNLNSGAAEALIYDSLKALGEESKYKIIWGKLLAAMSIAQGIAVLLGGVLADKRFLYAYILGGVLQLITLLSALGFYEVPIARKIDNRREGNAVVQQLRTAVKVLRGRKFVLYIILFSALMSSLQTTVFFYSQKYFSDMNYTKTVIAVICALGSLVEAFCSKYAYVFEEKMGMRKNLIFIASLNILALWGLGALRNLAVVFFIFTEITGGIACTIFSDYVNSKIPSENRATILSFDSLCFSMFMICIFPLFGFMADKIGFSSTFGFIGFAYVPVVLFIMTKLNKINRTA